MKKNYQKTLTACYLGFITQAITANFAPLLFLSFHSTYSIPLGTIALIPTVFFLTQLVVDYLCAKFVDRIGYRKCVIGSEIASAAGLIFLTFLPNLLPSPFLGIILSTVLYAIGSGLIEVLVSPITEACPFEHKEAVMSTLHSFYCWGSVGVILLSTLFFHFFGIENWRWMAILWSLIPIWNIFNFATCPIERLVDNGQGMSVKQLFQTPAFWTALVLMICAGASELSMSQWASAFAESALHLSKTIGDLLGPCLFAVAMGLSRSIYGKFGDRIPLTPFMYGSAALCLLCYILSGFFSLPVLNLLGCILCGFSVAIMWPGTISLSSKSFPTGGTAMFALLAMAGDLGGSIGPGLVGFFAQLCDDQLRCGLCIGCVFPVVLIISLFLMTRLTFKKGTQSNIGSLKATPRK